MLINPTINTNNANTHYKQYIDGLVMNSGLGRTIIERIKTEKILTIKKIVREANIVKVVVGAGGIYDAGWIPTDQDTLDLLNRNTWDSIFTVNSIDNILAEHVFEHFTLDNARLAIKNCGDFLKGSGNLRIAVPDGFHPDKEYIDYVKPNGCGAGSDDHKVLYDYRSLLELFKNTNFKVELLEYFDETGEFHYQPWDINDGKIRRSKIFDPRNQNGELKYTSLIIDAKKITLTT